MFNGLRSMKRSIIILLAVAIIVSGFICFLSNGLKKKGENASAKPGGGSIALDELKSLPYLSWSSGKSGDHSSGVVKHDRARAFPGYNLYTDNVEHAYLMDLDGRVVHRWRFPSREKRWEFAKLLGNGEIAAYCEEKFLVKLDRGSNVVWRKCIPAHHDIAVLPDGTFLVPVFEPYVMYNSRLVRFDAILHISGAGKVLEKWSASANLDKLKKLHPPLPLDEKPDISAWKNALGRFYLRRVRNLSARIPEFDRFLRKRLGLELFDYYHLNTIDVLPETPLGGKDKRFRAGNYLLCLRHADLILILDKDSKDVAWKWGVGVLDWPHMPKMLEDGNILVYDNGAHRSYSRLLELDPVEERIVWEYRAEPPEDFYSETRGSGQRLPNGNTLVCESERGRAFEITGQGEIVWEFLNPEVKDGKRKLIYRMMRVPRQEVEPWLVN